MKIGVCTECSNFQEIKDHTDCIYCGGQKKVEEINPTVIMLQQLKDIINGLDILVNS